MRPCVAGPASPGSASQRHLTRRSASTSVEVPVCAVPESWLACSSADQGALSSCDLARGASGSDPELVPAGQGAVVAGGAPAGGWQTELAHIWSGANPAQPRPPSSSGPVCARLLGTLDESAGRTSRALDGSPDRASACGVLSPSCSAGPAEPARPGAAETLATLAAPPESGERLEREQGGRASVGAVVQLAEPTRPGAAAMLALVAAPAAGQRTRCEVSGCETVGPDVEPAEPARPDEAERLGALTLGAPPVGKRARRKGSGCEGVGAAAAAVAAAAIGGTAVRPRRLPGGDPLSVRVVPAGLLSCLGARIECR